MAEEKLFTDFPPVPPGRWKEKIKADLKGKGYQEKMVWNTEEGFSVEPFYRLDKRENFSSGIFRKMPEGDQEMGNDWLIRQDFRLLNDPRECNSRIKQALGGGIQAAGIDFSGQENVSPETIESLFRDIDPASIEWYFMNIAEPSTFIESFAAFLSGNGTDPALLSGSLGIDPYSEYISAGIFSPGIFDRLSEVLKSASAQLPGFRTILIDAGRFQDGGSTLSQELGFGLAIAHTCLDELSIRGLDPGKVSQSITFSFSTGPGYFMEIAKLRAARRLWAVLLSAWDIDWMLAGMHIHSRSASWNLAMYDPYVNLLRTTTETMSASLGGSDVITVRPFDTFRRQENEFSSRVARNSQVILKEESHFNKVSDPAAGSFYIEQLTESLSDQAWKHLLETEDHGGFANAFREGWVQQQVEDAKESRKAGAASGEKKLVGVNRYPDFNELILQELEASEIPSGSIAGDIPPIRPFRIAAEIEDLRLQTERSGMRPKVFLLRFGDPERRNARALFAGNFFACAGYQIIEGTETDSLEGQLAAARRMKADVIVLCSSDDAYPEITPQVTGLTRGEAVVAIAGYPEGSAENLEKLGIRYFIHGKSNLLETLKEFQAVLGVDAGNASNGLRI